MAWAEAYLHDIKWHLDPSSRLATMDMSQIFWGYALFGGMPFFWGGELGPHLTQCRLGRGLPLCQVAS